MTIFLSAIPNPPLGPELVAVGHSEISIAGSSTWQMVFLSFAICLILFEVIRGWRLGLMRQLMRVLAVVAGYAAAYFGGDLLVPFLRSYLEMPDIVISLLGGAILAVALYAIISSLGTFLFKRTAQQGSSGARLLYGISGALLGLCFAAFFIWLSLIGIRTVGSIAEAQVEARPKPDPGQNSVRPSDSSIPSFDADSVMTSLARLKNSVELGTVGDVVKKTDVMPTGVYQTLSDTGTVLSNPESARRFLDFPGVKELSENPKLEALRNDPEIAEMIAQGRLIELLRHPRVVEAINDPALVEQVKRFDLKSALEHAKGKE